MTWGMFILICAPLSLGRPIYRGHIFAAAQATPSLPPSPCSAGCHEAGGGARSPFDSCLRFVGLRREWDGREGIWGPIQSTPPRPTALDLHPTPPSLLALMPYLEAKYPTCCEISRLNGRLQQRFIVGCFHRPPSLSVFVTLAGSPHLLLRARVTGPLARVLYLYAAIHGRRRRPAQHIADTTESRDGLLASEVGAFYDSRH